MATAAGNLHYLLISKKIMRSDWKILLKTKTTPRLWRTPPEEGNGRERENPSL